MFTSWSVKLSTKCRYLRICSYLLTDMATAIIPRRRPSSLDLYTRALGYRIYPMIRWIPKKICKLHTARFSFPFWKAYKVLCTISSMRSAANRCLKKSMGFLPYSFSSHSPRKRGKSPSKSLSWTFHIFFGLEYGQVPCAHLPQLCILIILTFCIHCLHLDHPQFCSSQTTANLHKNVYFKWLAYKSNNSTLTYNQNSRKKQWSNYMTCVKKNGWCMMSTSLETWIIVIFYTWDIKMSYFKQIISLHR